MEVDNETAVQAAKNERTVGGFLKFVGRNMSKAITVVSGSRKLRALTAAAISSAALAIGMSVEGEDVLLMLTAVAAFAGWGPAPVDDGGDGPSDSDGGE